MMERPSLLVPWALLSALLLGLAVTVLYEDRFLATFIVLGASALVIAAVASVRSTRDLLNPFTLIVGVGFARFLVPWVEIRAGAAEGEPTLEAMGITTSEWDSGGSFVILGLLGLAIVWWWMTKRSSTSLRVRSMQVGFTVALGAASLGLIGIVLFFITNAAASEVVSGGFRSVEIQEGTGIYFYVSLLLIPSSVILTDALLHRGSRWWVGLGPVLFAGAAYFVLGGRARAVTPILAGLIVLWYQRRSRINPLGILLASALCAFLLLWFGFVGDLYRGGGGLQALGAAARLEGFSSYIKGASLIDIGQLHGVVGALRVGPTVLAGQTFMSALAWPVSSLLGWPGRSVGVMAVEETMELTSPGWGFHPSVIGEAYVNFGPVGILIVGSVFGLFAAVLYRMLREGRLPLSVYAVAVVYVVRIFFESIQKWPEALVVLSAALVIQWISQRRTVSLPAPQSWRPPRSTLRTSDNSQDS